MTEYDITFSYQHGDLGYPRIPAGTVCEAISIATLGLLAELAITAQLEKGITLAQSMSFLLDDFEQGKVAVDWDYSETQETPKSTVPEGYSFLD